MDNKEAGNKSLPPEKARELRGISRRTMFHISAPFIYVVAILDIFTVFLRFLKGTSYSEPMTIVLILVGAFVAFFGSFYDFGAKRFLSDISEHMEKITDDDVVYINKQQLTLNIIFLGIAGLYVLSAFVMYYFVII